jgi:hypothetical protein
MRQDLTNLLRAVPFVPFTVKTRDGEVHAVNTVERMSVGNYVCTFIDGEGYVLLIPFTAIDHVAAPDSEHPA